jgi:hypothetical protein
MVHVAGPLHNLWWKKEKRIQFNIICLKLYQFKKITWWCLYVMENIMEVALQLVLNFVMMEEKK